MGNKPIVAPRVVSVGLTVLLMVVLAAIPWLAVASVQDREPMLTPAWVLTSIFAAVGAGMVWMAWCDSRPATRAMAARYHALRELMDRAEDLDPLLTDDGMAVVVDSGFDEWQGQSFRAFVRVPVDTDTTSTVHTLDGAPAPRPADMFVIYDRSPVVLHKTATVHISRHGGVRLADRRIRRRRRTGLRAMLAQIRGGLRESRTFVNVASLDELDTLIAALRTALDWPGRTDNTTRPAHRRTRA